MRARAGVGVRVRIWTRIIVMQRAEHHLFAQVAEIIAGRPQPRGDLLIDFDHAAHGAPGRGHTSLNIASITRGISARSVGVSKSVVKSSTTAISAGCQYGSGSPAFQPSRPCTASIKLRR